MKIVYLVYAAVGANPFHLDYIFNSSRKAYAQVEEIERAIIEQYLIPETVKSKGVTEYGGNYRLKGVGTRKCDKNRELTYEIKINVEFINTQVQRLV